MKQVIVALVDVGLVLLLFASMLVSGKPAALHQWMVSFNSTWIIVISLIVYRLLFLLILNGTIGMKLCNVVLLNSNLQPLKMYERCLAACFILYRGVAYYNQRY